MAQSSLSQEGRGHVTDWLLGYKGEEFYSLLKREMLGGVLWKNMVSGFDGGNLLEVEVQGFVVKGEGQEHLFLL